MLATAWTSHSLFFTFLSIIRHHSMSVQMTPDQQEYDLEPYTREVMSVNGSNSSLITGNSSNSDEEDAFYQTYSWSSDFMMRYSPTISAVYCLAYTIVFAMGIIGNSCVVAVVFRSPRMRTVTNYFIVNLALADILVLLFCLPATLLSNLFIRKFFFPDSPVTRFPSASSVQESLNMNFDKRFILCEQ